MATQTSTNKPPAYVAANDDGTFDAFVEGKGFAANCRLPAALAFIRRATGKQTGWVPLLLRSSGEWDSELDLAKGA